MLLSHDGLQEEIEKLLALLQERETGLFTWHIMLNKRLAAIHAILCPFFGPNIKKFRLHWLDGKESVVEGTDIVDASLRAGIGGDALLALDYYEEI